MAEAEAACGRANHAAFDDAERLGYWDHPLSADEQADYYRGRSSQVEVLATELRALTPSDFGHDWAATVALLDSYAQWAADNVSTIEATSSTVSEQSPGSLQSFRSAFETGRGNVCQDLFDMN